MKWILVFSVLTIFVPLSNADECAGNDKGSKTAPLHHIIEFGKRNKVGGKGCEKKKHADSKSSGAVLGLHGLLHARSQQKNRHNTINLKEKSSSNKNNPIEKPKNQVGSKRTSSQLHKLQLRAETISMLHKIVEKYFPGGHLTVDQKIKALKILGKLIKLKKEGKNSDIKKLLGALSVHHQNDANASNDSKGKEKGLKNGQSGKKDKTDKTDGGDIYANIASGPDVPKLPPAVSEKDPDHAHSNIMPVGLQPMGGEGAGEMMNTMTRSNDMSDMNMNDRVSNFQAPLSHSRDTELGQAYGNGFMGNGMGLSSIPSMIDGQGYVRSRMPYPRRRPSGRDWLGARRRFYDDEGDDDDDYDDDDEEDDDEEEGQGRARSYVNRHRYYDDDDDDDDDVNDAGEEIEYSRRFDRKDKIAKSPKNSKDKLQKHNK